MPNHAPNPQRVAQLALAKQRRQAGQTWYHLTNRSRFKLDPTFEPQDNAFAIEDRSGRPGIYLGTNVGHWLQAQGYWRPFLVELDVDPKVMDDPGIHGRWGGELFVPATSFDKIKIKRVIPIDAYAREEYGGWGWVERAVGRTFDTGEPIEEPPFNSPLSAHYPNKGYRYPGPDVRKMPAGKVNQLKKDLREALRYM